ncbi:MAG: hypothetical protein ACYDC1_17420 [Limisphaerales bacterium]
MHLEIKNNALVLTIPLQDPTPSSTGKTMVIASTRGTAKTNVTVNFQGKQLPVNVGFNAFIKP